MSNFTGQKIKDTYQALLQISGSDTLADGTGSVVTNLDISASYATTASYALNGGVTSLIAGDNISISSGTGDITISASTGSAETVNTGSLLTTASFSNPDITFTKGDGTTFTNTLTTLVPTTAQTASYVEGANVDGTVQNAVTASYTPNALVTASVSNATTTFEKGDGSSFFLTVNNVNNANFAATATSASHSEISDFAFSATSASFATSALLALSASHAVQADNATTADSATTATSATSASYASNAEQLDGLDSTAFAILSANNTFTGATNTFNNDIVINGTASISYLRSVTGSAKIIGDAFIILNADTPTAPFAGVKIYDTGSASTASLEWNGNGDYWILVDEVGQSAPILTGNTGSKGSETFPTLNTIVKGGGENRLVDSIITDDGSTVTVSGDISASVFEASTYFAGDLIGTASYASFALTASYAENAGTTVDTGSFVKNDADIYTASAKIEEVVTLTQAEYDALGTPSSSFYYVIVDSDELQPGLVEGSGLSSLQSALSASGAATGTKSIAIGSGSSATNDNTVGLGTAASATHTGSIAIGNAATSIGEGCIAIGSGSYGSVNDAIAIGTAANVINEYSIAIGYSTNNGVNCGPYTLALGYNATALGDNSIVIGKDASNTIGTTNSVVIGPGADAGGDYSVALGSNATAGTGNDVAIGADAQSGGGNSIAIGSNATANSLLSMAIGQAATATDVGAIAIGLNSRAANDSVTVGGGGSQDNGNIMCVTIGNTTYSTAQGQITIGREAVGSSGATNAITIGREAVSSGVGGVAMGYQASAATESIAIGEQATATQAYCVALGSDAEVSSGSYSVAIGKEATSSGAGGIAMGYQASAAAGAVAIGSGSLAPATNTIAIGADATGFLLSTVVGGNASATGTDATVLGKTATGHSYSVAVGSEAESTNGGVAIGYQANVDSTNGGIAIGSQSGVSIGALDGIAIGRIASAADDRAVAIGHVAVASGESSVAIGHSSQADSSTLYSVAIGYSALTGGNNVDGDAAIAIGSGSNAANDRSIAMGAAAKATANDAIAIGTSVTAASAGEINIGDTFKYNGSSLITLNDSVDIKGSLQGDVSALTITSTTASMDCSLANFFTLTLANGVDTHLDVTNIQAGQTINVKLTNNATSAGTISFAPEFQFVDGTAFTVTAATSAVDVITFISFDGTSLQATGVKNFS